MSVTSDLQYAFAERELTVPVQLVRTGAVTRGFLDRGITLEGLSRLEIEHGVDVLHLQRGTLPGLLQDDELLVGALGATAATGGTTFVVRGRASMNDDGEMEHRIVVEVPTGTP